MNTFAMDYRFESRDPRRRLKGIAIVVLLHVFIGYALMSGLARKGLDLVRQPMKAVVIQEVTLPPPPPPPPPPKRIEKPVVVPKRPAPPPPYVPPSEVVPQAASTAPAIAASTTPPPEPPAIAPPAPPPTAPVAAGPRRAAIGVACPTQVAPDMPRKALMDGIEGVVKAQIHIRDGGIQDVTILSGPKVFHAAVKAAMLQYKCVADGSEVIATQEFNFHLN